ncbi:cytochrome P450 [Sphingomonas sp. GB1N7]|uniref:cytochrome P450 n=1 Tax=Parasphingomonas caseinilytica TaxID=3096158 RepID=UPI002FC6EEB8
MLLDHGSFVSGQGIALNDPINLGGEGTTLASDPPVHQKLRGIIAAPLQPKAVALLRKQIQQAADDLIDRLAARGRFDGVVDLARFLPLAIVSNLVGLPEQGRENMLDWAAAIFDCLGPANDRFTIAAPVMHEMMGYVFTKAGRAQVKSDSWAARIFEAADAGIVSHQQVPILLLDYLGPSLDTTIFATAHLLNLLGQHPDQWQQVRADPALVDRAIDEAVRLESPIRGFSRVATRDIEVGDGMVPEGKRVLVLFASANRDDRKWIDPERFDVTRPDVRSHVGFGLGRHVCAGQHLARLEMACLVRAMVERMPEFTVGAPVVQANNVLRGFASMPVSVVG